MEALRGLVSLVVNEKGNLIRKFAKSIGLKYIGSGKDRHVFKNPYTHSVVKIPANINGINANECEYRYYHGDRDPRYARCSLELLDGVPIIHMEAVREISYIDGEHKTLPAWTDWVDCQQVGYTKDGRLVAYDYADSRL